MLTETTALILNTFKRKSVSLSEINNLLGDMLLFLLHWAQPSIKALKSELISTTSPEAVLSNPSQLAFNLSSQPANGIWNTQKS